MSDENENKTLECMSDSLLDLDDEDPKRMSALMACADAFEYRITWTGDDGMNRGYYVFDQDPRSGRWQTESLYSGTNGRYEVDGELPPTIGENNANYLGEWIQIELPSPKAIESYEIVCGTDNVPMEKDIHGFPGTWVVLGSMTGENRSWVRVHGRAMNQTMWERNGKYVLDSEDPEEDEPFYIRLVHTENRYVMASEYGDTAMEWCDEDNERDGNEGNFLTNLRAMNDASRERAEFVVKKNGNHAYWQNRYLDTRADKCKNDPGSTPSNGSSGGSSGDGSSGDGSSGDGSSGGSSGGSSPNPPNPNPTGATLSQFQSFVSERIDLMVNEDTGVAWFPTNIGDIRVETARDIANNWSQQLTYKITISVSNYQGFVESYAQNESQFRQNATQLAEGVWSNFVSGS